MAERPRHSRAGRDWADALAPAQVLRATLVVVGVLAAVWLAAHLASVVFLAFVAAILAAGALGPVATLERRGLPTVAAVIVVYASIAVALAVLLFLVAPPVIGQVIAMMQTLPGAIDRLAARYRDILGPLGLAPDTGSLVDIVVAQLGSLTALIPSIPLAILGVAGSAVSAVFLSVLMLLERRRGRLWLMRFVSPDDHPLVDTLVDEAVNRLGGYIRGQLLIMSATGLGSALGLIVIGVPFAIPLGLFAFFVEAIPIAGPTIAGAVMIGFALLESPAQAVATLVLVIGLQQLEGLVLVPQIQGRVISISPAVALVGVIAGSTLAGVGGALIAIPVIAITKVVVDEIVLPWRRREIRAASGRRGESEAATETTSSSQRARPRRAARPRIADAAEGSRSA